MKRLGSSWHDARRRRTLLFTVVVALLLASSGTPGPVGVLPQAEAIGAPVSPLVPPADGHSLFGVQLAWIADTPAEYVTRSGIAPAQYGDFLDYPLSRDDKDRLNSEAAKAKAAGADFFLTLEPVGGLSTVNASNARDLAMTLASLNRTGVRFYVRFAHEMNGGWYPWGQQPTAYIAAYRTVADAVHSHAPGNAMVWSPNYGGGYPFDGGGYVAQPGTADFAILDTNQDGALTMSDDMYTPFYPGDAYVDWVGLTMYWFGYVWPWGDNETPDAGRFPAQLTGTYNGAQDERGVPDFYRSFAVNRNKPLAISETAAQYNTNNPIGDTELAIKSAWMDQVLAPSNSRLFPKLKMVNWFEHQKSEQENYGLIDWRATANPDVLNALRQHLTTSPSQFLFAPTH